MGLHLRREGVRYIVPRLSGPACVLRMIALPGRTREVSEVEPPELRLRHGLLLLITLGQPVKHDGVEVNICIHKRCSEHLSLLYASSRRIGGALA
jgi:hypothetical protein